MINDLFKPDKREGELERLLRQAELLAKEGDSLQCNTTRDLDKLKARPFKPSQHWHAQQELSACQIQYLESVALDISVDVISNACCLHNASSRASYSLSNSPVPRQGPALGRSVATCY